MPRLKQGNPNNQGKEGQGGPSCQSRFCAFLGEKRDDHGTSAHGFVLPEGEFLAPVASCYLGSSVCVSQLHCRKATVAFRGQKQQTELSVAQNGPFGALSLTTKSSRKNLRGSLFCALSEEVRHINFLQGPQWGFVVGAKQFTLKKFMCCFCP